MGATIARSGILAQFELWKSFAKRCGYPINRKQAAVFAFGSDQERDVVGFVVDVRNTLTPEVSEATDPTLRRIVEYAWECRYLARRAWGEPVAWQSWP